MKIHNKQWICAKQRGNKTIHCSRISVNYKKRKLIRLFPDGRHKIDRGVFAGTTTMS